MLWRRPKLQSLLELANPRLDGSAAALAAGRVGSAGEWARLWSLADSHGVLGFVLHNLEQGSLIERRAAPADRPVPGLARARQVWRAQRVKTLKVRQVGEQLLEAIAQAGIPAALIKGSDFAHHLYPTPSLRPTRDLDLLVPHCRWPDVHRVLRQLGFALHQRPGCTKVAKQFGEQSWRRVGGDQMVVDLHWNLVNRPTMRRRLATAFEDLAWHSPASSAGATLSPLPETRLVIAAVHAAVSHQFERLLHLCDLREACRPFAARDRIGALQTLLAATGTPGVVAVALAVASRLLGCPMIREVAACLSPRPTARWASRLITAQAVLLPHQPLPVIRRRLFKEWVKIAA